MAYSSLSTLTDEFPRYSDGDVLIVLSPSRQYQLHSRTLILHSDYFRRGLTDDNAATLSAKARRDGVTIRFRMELDLPQKDDPGVGRFWIRPLDDRGRPQSAYTASDLEAGKVPLPLYNHYDNLFRLYYYQPARLNDTNITEVLRDVVGLADVAEQLGSMHTVSLVIDNALIKQGQILYRSIATNATAWADLAFRVRSELIFREALIHLVGQWPKLLAQSPSVIDTLRPEIRELCGFKHRELDDMKRAIELRIMGHYPQHMQRPTNNNVGPGSHTIRGTGKSTRANAYASDAFAWMSLNLFRHWLGQHVCGDMNRHAPDGGFNFYHAIKKGGDAYIDHNAVESFAKYFPLSAKARNAFLAQLNILKESVRAFVDSLVENKSMLDISKWPVRYLTCLPVKKADMPWHVPDDAPTTTTQHAHLAPAGANPRKRRRDDPIDDDDDADEADARPSRRLRQNHPPYRAQASSPYHADLSDDETDFDDDTRDQDYGLSEHQHGSRKRYLRGVGAGQRENGAGLGMGGGAARMADMFGEQRSVVGDDVGDEGVGDDEREEDAEGDVDDDEDVGGGDEFVDPVGQM